ncbi:MAG: undecaprenyldiphospho-muramoylpentapeptide beta-N-acetylglucosaminyltransferase [Nitrospirae bacterium]|nr:undecaprenyldiphospho-muramoylpentapeptide beta-N-acetylglucosaminyltransferase [Nitrospirota bacterium]
MRIIIAGGGTGGHLYPGIAVADEFCLGKYAAEYNIQKRDIIFIGTESGIEAKVIPQTGYQIRFLKAEGLSGKPILKKVRSLFLFLISFVSSLKIIRQLRPDIVIGVGGYASAAMVLAAVYKGFPTIILEQNLAPGMANKFLSRFVDAVAVSFYESMEYFHSDKIHLTGTPIRREMLLKGDRDCYSLFSLQKDRFTVFIFGGSQGAASINNAVIESLNYLLDLRQNIQFMHQTGTRDFERVREAYRKFSFEGMAAPFIYQMAEAYAAADLVVCRAGAATLAEITALGKPAVLIPYPHAAANHQQYNAQKLDKTGAARMILDRDLNGELLADTIRELYLNEGARKKMQAEASAFGKPDAAEKIVDIARSLIRSKMAKK